jgi:hypothetical protein
MVYGPSIVPNALPPGSTDPEKSAAAAKRLPGIPFYTYRGVCNQEAAWLEPQTTLALTVTSEDGAAVSQTMTLNNRAFHDPAPDPAANAPGLVAGLNALQGSHDITVTNSPYCPAVAAAQWQAVGMKYAVTPIPETQLGIDTAVGQLNLLLITNTAASGTAVDYSRVYYLNAKSPLNGTASVDAKLNTDGTLSEGSVSRDDETLSTVLTTLSTLGSGALTAWSTVKAADITGQATVVAAAAPAIPGAAPVLAHCDAGGGWPAIPAGKKVTYAFSAKSAGFMHDHKKTTPLEMINGGMCIAGASIYDGSFAVTPVGGDKSDDSAIQVSGSVTLPKPKATKK